MQDMLLNVWNEIVYRLDVLRATNGAHVEVYWILVYWSIDWTVVVCLIETKMSWVVLLITTNSFKIAPKITNLLRLIMGWIIYRHSVFYITQLLKVKNFVTIVTIDCVCDYTFKYSLGAGQFDVKFKIVSFIWWKI
jgi:hypothetical protein